MASRKFNAFRLPYPVYRNEIGSLSIDESQDDKKENVKKVRRRPGWVPRFSHLIQVVEVSESRLATSAQLFPNVDDLITEHIVVHDARPELFVRRDFITKFIDNGHIHIATHPSSLRGNSYRVHTENNVMVITMNEKQYRRFGIIAKKETVKKSTGSKVYRIEVDLKDSRLVKSNKFQDNLISKLRLLDAIKRLYVRYVPHVSEEHAKATDRCREFLDYVIDEYAADGFKPVPLSGYTVEKQKLARKWVNFEQHRPEQDLRIDYENIHSDADKLDELIELVDWFGYQLLSIDDKTRVGSQDADKVHVACMQLDGVMDFEDVQSKILATDRQTDGVIMRAVFLYSKMSADNGDHQNDMSCVVVVQDLAMRLASGLDDNGDDDDSHAATTLVMGMSTGDCSWKFQRG